MSRISGPAHTPAPIANGDHRRRRWCMLGPPVVAAAIGLAAPAGAGGATEFTFGKGIKPDLAVDGAGTAHVVWLQTEAQADRVVYCRIPRGARACTGTQELSAAKRLGGPFVLVPAPGQVLVTLGGELCESGNACTRIRRSTDGGVTFGPPQTIHTSFGGNRAPYSTTVAGPGDTLSWTTAAGTGSLAYVNAPLTGQPGTGSARLFDSQPFHAEVALVVGMPVVVWVTQSHELFWRGWNGTGTVNDATRWIPAQRIDAESTGRIALASGRTGLFLMYGRRASTRTQHVVRKLTATGWTSPVQITEMGLSNTDIFDLHQDGSGRLHAIAKDQDATPDALLWRTSTDGVRWTDTVSIHDQGSVFKPLSVAAAGDGLGFAAWDSLTPGGAVHDLRAVPLEPLAPPMYAGPLRPVTVSDRQASFTFTVPRSCVNPGQKFRATLKWKRKKRKGNRFVKVRRADFYLGRTRVKVDKKAPFVHTFDVRDTATPGTRFRLRARAFIKVKRGKSPTKSIRATIKVCP